MKIVCAVGQSSQQRNKSYSQYSSTAQQARNSTNGQDDDNRNRRADDDDGPVTGSRNSNDVDTSRPDQVPDVRKMEVCEV